MNDVQTNSVVAVSTAVYEESAISAAKAVLQGSHEDYYFFQYADNDYVLLVGDITFNALGCETGLVTVYEFVTFPVSSARSVTIPFSGSQSGNYGGSDGAGGFNGSVTGNSTIQIQSETKYNVSMYVTSAENIIVTNSNSLVYGSGSMLPHLIEGVENYAFAAFWLTLCVICFKLFDRIFRRVY